MKLKYDVGDKPLWAQLFDILLDRIVSKEYNAGDKMPTDLEIMQEFDVSRMTVRQAMNKLINEGYIERRRGKGTIVLEKENKVETILKSSFNGVLEKNDIKNRRVLNVEMVNAGQEIADFFKELREVEEEHAKRFKELYDKLDKETIFKGTKDSKWVCMNCGYIYEGAEAPQKCPLCGYPKSYFKPYCKIEN